MSIESEKDFTGLSRAGKVVSLTLREMKQRLCPGMTTAELDAVGAKMFARYGARSAPQLVYGFPGTTLISLNDEAIHGIPGERVIQAGDLVKIDVTAELNGYIADAAITVALPPASSLKRRLRNCAESAFQKAIQNARAGRLINAIGRAVESEVRRQGFAVIPGLSGHGVGRDIHEAPDVPNTCDPGSRQRLTEGLVITIEPIISSGSDQYFEDSDGWTIKTVDGSLSAHYEHTVVITRGRPILLAAA
ncbi:MAG: type I methionyl aminopeptidase [Candidatus Latescibacteria bacterium]|nr:type I methionyl aminopeptidase [Candidatus Latescibacterota bacterium]